MQSEELYEYNPKCTVQFLVHLFSTTVLSILIMSCLYVVCSCKRQIRHLQDENMNLKNMIVSGVEEHIRRSIKNGYDSD